MPDDLALLEAYAGLPGVMPAHVFDAVAAGLWPSLTHADRREKTLDALGLKPCGDFRDRMVYIEREPRG